MGESFMHAVKVGFRVMQAQGVLAALAARGDGTRLAVLSLLLERPRASRGEVGRELGVTPQAVSAHVADLRARGWLQDGDGLTLTPAGVQALLDGGARLRRAVEALLRPLATLRAVSAEARCSLRAGQRVGLWMEDGDLMADDDARAGSQGVARNDAQAGQEVVVTALSGVVDLRPGTVTVVRLPGPAEGGVSGVDAAALAAVVGPGRVGAVGTGARILAQRTGRLDFAFGAAAATHNAALRGVDAWLLVTSDRLTEVLEELQRGAEVPVRLVDAPARAA